VKTRFLRRSIVAGTLGSLLGTSLGTLAGITALLGASTAVADRAGEATAASSLEATHLPALLTASDERVALYYDVYCGREDAAGLDAPCDAEASVFVRPGDAGTFERLPLRPDARAPEGRYVAEVPAAIARSRAGFSYYATFTSDGGSHELVLPAGGASAPQRSLPLGRNIDVRLPSHAFGHPRKADARVAEAAWGSGAGEVGLEQGRNLPPIGGSAFEVDSSGTVTVLDEANRRLLRWRAGSNPPSQTALAIDGTLADLAVADDGTVYVLESSGHSPRSNVLRSFMPNGSEIASGLTAERASEVRVGANGDAVVQQQPSGQWMVGASKDQVLLPGNQRKSGRSGRPLADGSEVVVLRRGNEIRVALVRSGAVERSWRVMSADALAEVQLAEPRGGNLVLVARVYTDSRDEFLVLVLGAKGLVHSFAVESADWAETAPVSRFRLAGSSLYQLGSTPVRVFVDRYDLEVK
jgi:hypothetical protein